VPRRSSAQIAADVLLALVKAPRTLTEISLVVNNDSNHRAQMLPFVEALREVGLVFICGEDRSGFPIYRFQAQPFQSPDVPLRASPQPGQRGRPGSWVTVDGKRMTVTEAIPLVGIGRAGIHKRVKKGKVLTSARKAANIDL
jgi:hypothetical protein